MGHGRMVLMTFIETSVNENELRAETLRAISDVLRAGPDWEKLGSSWLDQALDHTTRVRLPANPGLECRTDFDIELSAKFCGAPELRFISDRSPVAIAPSRLFPPT